jgi:hypothetical protein
MCSKGQINTYRFCTCKLQFYQQQYIDKLTPPVTGVYVHIVAATIISFSMIVATHHPHPLTGLCLHHLATMTGQACSIVSPHPKLQVDMYISCQWPVCALQVAVWRGYADTVNLLQQPVAARGVCATSGSSRDDTPPAHTRCSWRGLQRCGCRTARLGVRR